jgi:hypothetical protein
VVCFGWCLVFLSCLTPASAQSILPNGGFEQQFVDYDWPVYPFWDFTDDYRLTPQVTIVSNPAFAQEGSRYLTFDYAYSNHLQATHMIFPAEPGARYRVRFYHRVSVATPAGATSVHLRWFSDYVRGPTRQLGELSLLEGLGAATNGWALVEQAVTVPQNAVGADLLVSGTSSNGQGRIHFDNFTVEKTSGPYSATLHMLFEGNTFQSSTNTAQAELVGSMAGLLSQVGAGEYIYIHNLYGNNAADVGSTHYRWACLLASLWGARLDFSYDTKAGCWALLNKLKSHLPKQQYIRYDYSDNYSCRWAMSLCGLEQCLAVHDSIATMVESRLGLTQQESVLKGCGGTDTEAKAWARFTHHPQANRDLISENSAEPAYLGQLNANGKYKYYLSDLAVAAKSWFFWDADRGEPQNTYLAWMNPDFRHLGVLAGDEGLRIADVSARGGTVVPADWGWNLATHKTFQNVKPVHPMRARPRTWRDLNWENGVSYCTFVVTDGDNLIVTMGSYATDSRWFGSPRRGATPLGWQLPPSANRFAPAIWAHYVYPLSPFALRDDECVLTGVSGDGIFYVGAADAAGHTLGALTSGGRDSVLSKQAAGLNQWLKAQAVNSITGFVWNNEAWTNSQSGWDVYGAALERPLGFLVDTYDASYTGAHGDLKWTRDKDGNEIPVKACDAALWEPAQTPFGHTHQQMADLINTASHPANPTPASFLHVSAHAWSWADTLKGQQGIVEEVYQTKQLLAGHVRMVRPDEFLLQLRLRLKTGQELTNYAARLQAKLDQLDGSSTSSAAAATVRSQAKTVLAQAKGLIPGTPEAAFNSLKEADRLTEVARLSFLTLQITDGLLVVNCVDEAVPLHHFSLREIDPAALPVRQYQAQFSDSSRFTNLLADVTVGEASLRHTNYDCWVRVRAQGDSHGDWGEWTQPAKLPRKGEPGFRLVPSQSADQGEFRFRLEGPPGAQAVIQRSPDLQQWQDWQPVTLSEAPVDMTDTMPSVPEQRFYRALLVNAARSLQEARTIATPPF